MERTAAAGIWSAVNCASLWVVRPRDPTMSRGGAMLRIEPEEELKTRWDGRCGLLLPRGRPAEQPLSGRVQGDILRVSVVAPIAGAFGFYGYLVAHLH